MLPEIELDVIRFFDRAGLEELQIRSRYLLNLVNRHARTLPLRYIRNASIKDGAAWIDLVGHRTTLAPGDKDEEMLFDRLNNAFVHRLTLSFCQENLHLLHYLRANANVLKCEVGLLSIGDTSKAIDYALVDFLGAHLKPSTYETLMFHGLREDYAMFFARDAWRGNVKHLTYILRDSPAPSCILRELFGVGVVETCKIATRIDPRPWIGTFVKMFETAERGTLMVRWVMLLDLRLYKAPSSRHTVESFGRPLRTDAPTPPSGFKEKTWPWKLLFSDGTTTIESPVAKLFVFENASAARKLEVFEWTIEHSGAKTGLSYAYLLRVVRM